MNVNGDLEELVENVLDDADDESRRVDRRRAVDDDAVADDESDRRRHQRRRHRGGAAARGARGREVRRERRPPARGRGHRGRARRLRRRRRGGRRGCRPRRRDHRRGRARRLLRRLADADEPVVLDATTRPRPPPRVDRAWSGGPRRTRRRSVDPPWRVVRRAHPVGLREEGHRQPPCTHPEHEHGGQDLRGRHPDGGRRRVQERQEADRSAQGVPRLPARALPHGRRVVVLHPQHARRHRLRRPEPPGPEADPAHPPRGADVPVGQG